MQQYSNSLFRQFPNSVSGNAAIGVSVNVYELGTTNHVTLYADDDLGGTALPNPLTTNDIGFYSFYAPDGKYTLHFGSSQFPDLNIQLIDALSLVNEFNTAQAATGFILIDNGFTAGYTVTQRNEALLYDGVYYVWKGALNKAVPPASSPATTGGIGDGAWQAVLDNALRQQLLDGTANIAGRTAQSIADLRGDLAALSGIKALKQVAGAIQTTLGYHTNSGVGDHQYVWNPARSWLDHNGGTVLSSQAMAVYDGTTATLPAFLNFSSTAGSGCWELILKAGTAKPEITPEMFGALPAPIDSYLSIQKSIDSYSDNYRWSASGDYAHSQTIVIDGKRNSEFKAITAQFVSTGNIKGAIIDNIIECELEFGAFNGSELSPSTEEAFELKSIVSSQIKIGSARWYQKGGLINPVGNSGGTQPSRIVDGFYYNKLIVNNLGRSDGVSPTQNSLTITTTSNTLHPNYSDGQSGRSYVNENEFHLKGLRCAGTGIKFVKGAGQWDQFNGNTFYMPGLESVKTIGIDLAFAEGNVIFYPRFEAQSSLGNFSQWLIREQADCGFNTFHLHRVIVDKLQILGGNSEWFGRFINSSGLIIANKINSGNSGSALTYESNRTNQTVDQLRNGTRFINGNTTPTDVNSPFNKYAGFVKDPAGVVHPHGLLTPYSEQLIASFTNGQDIQVTLASFVRLRGSEASVNLVMNAKREIAGFCFILEIDTSATTEVYIKSSAGNVQIQHTAFDPTGTDTRGLFMLVYRDFGWRCARISDRLKNA